ncbi:hypothetical protein, partial [Pseudonocardia alni]
MSSSHRSDDNSSEITRQYDDNHSSPALCHPDEELFVGVGARMARELGPVAMPDDVAARMRARLAAEMARAAPGPERGEAPAAGGPPPGRRTPWRA